MQPLISVIVPIYNIERFLDKCVTSIINQTYKNIEILLIDDGATDSCPSICDSFAEKDSRVVVYHKKNGGLSSARNYGIERINGEYFCIVDGDDSIRNDYIEVMYNLIKNEPDADFTMCSYLYIWGDGRTKRTKNFEYPDDTVFKDTGEAALLKMLYGKIYSPSTWSKLYRTDRFTAKFDPSYSVGEDVLALTDMFYKSKLLVLSNQPCYYYYQNERSLTNFFNPKVLFDNVRTASEIYKKCEKFSPEIKKAAAYYLVEKNFIVLMKFYGHSECAEQIEIIKSNIKKYRKIVLTDSNAETRTRIACLISYLGIDTLCKIRNFISK